MNLNEDETLFKDAENSKVFKAFLLMKNQTKACGPLLTAKMEYSEAKEKDENAVLIYGPHKDIPNVFEIKTSIYSKSIYHELTMQIFWNLINSNYD